MKLRGKTNVQKLVIPKGTLGDNEIAVIEIPKRHKRTPIIIAKRNYGHLAAERADDNFLDSSLTEPPLVYGYNNQGGQRPQVYANNNAMVQSYPTQNIPAAVPVGMGYSACQQTVTCEPQQFSRTSAPMQSQFLPIQPQPSINQVNVPCTTCGFPPLKNSIPTNNSLRIKASQNSYYQLDDDTINLSKREQREKQLFTNSLSEFQKARRQFILSAKNFTGKLSKITMDMSDSEESL